MDSTKKALYFRYIEEVRKLLQYESPDERMERWKNIYNKFLELSISEEDKKTIISINETLLKSKFSSTTLQLFDSVNAKIKIQNKPFSAGMFSSKLIKTYLHENNVIDYSDLSSVAADIIQQPVTVQILLGIDLFADIEVPKKRQKVRHQKDPEKEKSKPSKVLNAQSDMPSSEVALVLSALNTKYEENSKPVIYWLLVVDPTSFSETVQNIFYISLLIKEGLARLFLEEENVLMIAPVPKKPLKDKFKEVDKNQATIQINIKVWKALVRHFKIKEAMIKWR